jgi:hypothetical protein
MPKRCCLSCAKLRGYLATVKKVPAEQMKPFDRILAEIEASTEMPTLVTLDHFKAGNR